MDNATQAEEIIDKFIKKVENKELNKNEAVKELMARPEINQYFDEDDLTLIFDFEL